MDEEKKKKRNKKKKNKQNNKAAEDTGPAGGDDVEAISVEQQTPLTNGQHHQNGVDDAARTNADPQKSNGVEVSGLAEDRQHWLQMETALEKSRETIKDLRNENVLHKEKEVDLQMKIEQLQKEKESWQRKEVSLEQKIGQISSDKASLEMKQEKLEDKIRQLREEHNSMILKEKSNTETIANMEAQISKLHLQVRQLEESKNVCSQENQRLTDAVTGLEAQIVSLENNSITTARALDEQMKRSSEYDILNSQMEVACALVEKLITENAELVEKVNELYLELGQRKPRDGLPSFSRSHSVVKIDETADVTDRISTSSNSLLVLGERTDQSEITQEMTGQVDKEETSLSVGISNSFKSDESGEIVQIPLDEIEVHQTEELQGIESEEKADVPFSDAPLIGAPFRLISFVASYVSGADLVDKK